MNGFETGERGKFHTQMGVGGQGHNTAWSGVGT